MAVNNLLLRLGSNDISNTAESVKYLETKIKYFVSHPDFEHVTYENDLALLRLSEPVLPFKPNIIPICIPNDDDNYDGQMAYVTGWGALYTGKINKLID